jgi:hypothetical protein
MASPSQATQGATSELIKALTAASASGLALQAEDLERALVEELLSLNPLVALLERTQATARVHEIARRTARQASRFEGELAKNATPGQSTYDRPTVTIKVLDYWGSVSGFQQAASKKFFDSLLLEQGAGVESVSEDLEFGTLWGASGTAGENAVSGGGAASGDPYQYNGFDRLIQTNVVDVNDVVKLSTLDNLIDAATGFRGAAGHPKAFLMSIGMHSKVSGLQTLARRETPDVEFEGGLRMSTYRNVPILESDYVKPTGVAVPAGLAAAAVAGGTLPDATQYFYRVASVTQRGEQVAAAEVNATTANPNLTIRLTWTNDPNALLYKIFRGTATGALSLLAVIPASSYDADGNPTARVTQFDDDGSYVAPAHSANQKPLDAGDEVIFLINRNKMQGASLVGMIDPLGQPQENFMSYIPLAITRGTYDFLIRVLVALQVPWERLHATARRVSVA